MLSAKARLVRFDKALSSTTPPHDVKPAKDPAICSHCQAVWHRGKWSLDLAVRGEVKRWGAPIRVVCPACRSATKGNPAGSSHE
jgi:hypothetical protein